MEHGRQDRIGRLAALPRTARIAVLVALAALIGFGLWRPGAQTPPGPPHGASDIALYRAIIARVKRGEPYEAAAVVEQSARNYPLRPFVAVRPPALATALAALPNEQTGDVLLGLLGAVVIAAWTCRLHALRPGPWTLAWAALAVFTGVGSAMTGAGASLFHDVWAGLLIALSLAMRTDKRFAAAVAFGLLAAFVRELALPYLALMALIALAERRRPEAAAFAAALAIALAALGLHAQAVSALVGPHAPASQGWVKMGGWGFMLTTAKWNLLAVLAGSWTTAVLVPIALFGAINWKSPTGLRLSAVLLAYTTAFMAIGRPENSYWGLIIAPLLAVGLALAPLAVSDVFGRAE